MINYREYMREYMRTYRETHIEECREYSRKWKEKHPEQSRKHREKWNRKNPEKVKVHGITNSYYHYHSVQKIRCEFCGSTTNLQRHHPNYDKPFQTITLCQICHKKVHGET